jgi:hypothetical protein
MAARREPPRISATAKIPNRPVEREFGSKRAAPRIDPPDPLSATAGLAPSGENVDQLPLSAGADLYRLTITRELVDSGREVVALGDHEA